MNSLVNVPDPEWDNEDDLETAAKRAAQKWINGEELTNEEWEDLADHSTHQLYEINFDDIPF